MSNGSILTTLSCSHIVQTISDMVFSVLTQARLCSLRSRSYFWASLPSICSCETYLSQFPNIVMTNKAKLFLNIFWSHLIVLTYCVSIHHCLANVIGNVLVTSFIN